MTNDASALLSKARHLWDRLSARYWFVPSLMMAGASSLALGMVWADLKLLGSPAGATVWLFSGGAEGARSVLSVVAGSVITVAGVGFSITIVTLTQASSQFGPRLLRTFMRDLGNQLVLGIWVGTFIYGILVLRTVRSGEDGGFVPHASVSVAVLLAVASVGALVYFIDHVSYNLQAPQLVAAVARDLEAVIARVFPEPSPGRQGRTEVPIDSDLLAPAAPGSSPVRADEDGYLQVVDEKTLMNLAESRDLRLYVVVRPGDFVRAGEPIVLVSPPDRLDGPLEGSLRASFFLGPQATDEQDPEFPINQMVEIAVRALSPGINDPFTAIHCIDWLGAGLARMARREPPSPLRRDGQGILRLVIRTFSFASAVDAGFNQIRQSARGSVAVTVRLLEVLGALGESLCTEEQREVVRRQVRLANEAGQQAIETEADRTDIDTRFRHALAALGG